MVERPAAECIVPLCGRSVLSTQSRGDPMRTVYFTATSLDGFIATEDDSLEWLFPLGDVNDTSYPKFITEVGALAMGSATYEWMLRHATTVVAEAGSAGPYTQPPCGFSNRSLPALRADEARSH